MGREYGISPFQILDMIGPSLVLGPIIIWLLVIGPLFVYPLARWKTHRAGQHDSQLGLKVALHYFAMIAFQLVLFAAAFIIYTVFSKEEGKGSMYRVGFALLLPAGLVLAAHLGLLQRTNQHQYPNVRRLFQGYNLIITGLLGFGALLLAFQMLFQKGSSGDMGRFALAATLVYVGAWAACGIQFGRLVMGDDSTGAPPDIVMPSSAPTSSTQHSGPTLPSLSAGSFPPLDTK